MNVYRRALTLAAVCAAALMLVPLQAQNGNGQGQGNSKLHKHSGKKIPNNYIVVLDQDPTPDGDEAQAAADADELIAKTRSGRVKHVYASALRGFSAEMSEEDAITLSDDPRVAYVEEDGEMEIVVTQSPTGSWGIDRIDEAALPLSNSYTYTTTGSGVNVYVIDTGIRVSHNQFGGRASVAFDAVGDGRNGIDCHGHGTHVAGTVGGSTYGVAKAARLFAVRVLNCSGSGSTSGVIAGVNWVTSHRAAPAVANMSLGGGVSTSLDSAVNNSINAGVTYAIAAGNANTNASNSSPARVSAAITVGSSTSADARSSFSNFGSVVDIFAPGSGITSAWSTSNTAINTISGTSMASPHVAGVAARYLQTHTTASPATVRNAIVSAANLNRLSGIPSGTANRLLFWSGAQ